MVTKLSTTFFIFLLVGISVVGSSANGQSVSSSAPMADFAQNLTVGLRGDDVSALQHFLITYGYLRLLSPTGYFGPLTRVALGAWQASVGISPAVGYFGPISRREMNVFFHQARMDNIVVVSSTVATTTTTMNAATAATTTTVPTTSTPVTNNENGSPARLIVPTLNIDAGFQYTGLKPDGTMEVPSTIYVVGWYTGSVRPGEKGVSIVTGHVAQIRGGVVTKPGVFSNLYEIKVGDKLQVVNDRGETINFVVREVRSYDPTADATDVFTSTDGGAHLNLITCEGMWIPSQVSYTERLVVFADLQ